MKSPKADDKSAAANPSREPARAPLSYIDKPDFYAPENRKGTKAFAAVAIAALLALAVGFTALWSPSAQPPANTSPAGAAIANQRVETGLISDPQEAAALIERLQKENAGTKGDGSQIYNPQIRAEILSGKRRVQFIRTLTPASTHEVIAISSDGAFAGNLDLGRRDAMVAYTFVPGQPVTLQETALTTSTVHDATYFNPGDGSPAIRLPLVAGQSITWTGVIK